jgi:hypothetical protein
MVAQDLTCYDIESWRGLLEFCTEDDGEPYFMCPAECKEMGMVTVSCKKTISSVPAGGRSPPRVVVAGWSMYNVQESKVTLRTQQRLDFPGFTTPYSPSHSPCLSGKRVLGSMKELAL